MRARSLTLVAFGPLSRPWERMTVPFIARRRDQRAIVAPSSWATVAAAGCANFARMRNFAHARDVRHPGLAAAVRRATRYARRERDRSHRRALHGVAGHEARARIR